MTYIYFIFFFKFNDSKHNQIAQNHSEFSTFTQSLTHRFQSLKRSDWPIEGSFHLCHCAAGLPCAFFKRLDPTIYIRKTNINYQFLSINVNDLIGSN
jgi:hypothetical protein